MSCDGVTLHNIGWDGKEHGSFHGLQHHAWQGRYVYIYIGLQHRAQALRAKKRSKQLPRFN